MARTSSRKTRSTATSRGVTPRARNSSKRARQASRAWASNEAPAVPRPVAELSRFGSIDAPTIAADLVPGRRRDVMSRPEPTLPRGARMRFVKKVALFAAVLAVVLVGGGFLLPRQ